MIHALLNVITKTIYLKKAAPKKWTSKLNLFLSIIQEKVELGCSASEIYRSIKKQGYEVKDSILRDYCSQLRKHTFKKRQSKLKHRQVCL